MCLQVASSERRVMGMSTAAAIATATTCAAQCLWDVPAGWTLAQAATVPVAYATAYDALLVRGRLRPGMRVLVHSAAGEVAPLPLKAFPRARAAEAFRFLGAGEEGACWGMQRVRCCMVRELTLFGWPGVHIGKVLVAVAPGTEPAAGQPSRWPAVPGQLDGEEDARGSIPDAPAQPAFACR